MQEKALQHYLRKQIKGVKGIQQGFLMACFVYLYLLIIRQI